MSEDDYKGEDRRSHPHFPEKSWWNTGFAHLVSAVLVAGITSYSTISIQQSKSKEARESISLEFSREIAAINKQLRLELAEKQIQIESLNRQAGLLEAELVRLRFQLDSATGEPRLNMVRVVDAFKIRPAWAKLCDPVKKQCTMLHVNSAYERHYGVTASKFRGKSDHEIFPEEYADQYLKHDLEVLENRYSTNYKETVYDIILGREIEQNFVKFHVELSDGTHVVAAIQLSV